VVSQLTSFLVPAARPLATLAVCPLGDVLWLKLRPFAAAMDLLFHILEIVHEKLT